MYRHILLPLDRSHAAEEVIPTAIAVAKESSAKVTLLFVWEAIPFLPTDRESSLPIVKAEAEAYLAGVGEQFASNGIPVETAFRTGDAALVICHEAEALDIDLLIITPQGQGAPQRLSLGHVADQVLRHSPKPVLLVRSKPLDLLRGRRILAVDDEQDILETIIEILDMCQVETAGTYESALEKLTHYRFDLVILDIMGVNGFELLKKTVAMGIPTVMLTAHALTKEALSHSARLGALSFLPKEKISELREILTEVFQGKGKPMWKSLFGRMAPYFKMRFAWNSAEEERVLKEIEELVRASSGE